MFHSTQSDSEPQHSLLRSDPVGSRTMDRDERETLSELRLRHVMERTRVQGHSDEGSNHLEKRQHHSSTPDSKDTIWNSFTGAYHGENNYIDYDHDYCVGLYSDDENLLDIPLPDEQHRGGQVDNWHMTYDQVPSRTTPRRVKFAEKLEIRTKTRPETPRTPTISILRKDLKHDGSQRRAKQEANKVSKTILQSRDINIQPPRDPTPKAEHEIPKTRSFRDPPTEERRFETPDRSRGIEASTNAHLVIRSADRLQGNPFLTPPPSQSVVRNVKSAEPEAQRRSLEPSAILRIGATPQRTVLQAMDLLHRNDRNVAEEEAARERRPVNVSTRSIDPTNARSSRIYPPLQQEEVVPARKEKEEAPVYMPPTPREEVDDVPLAWRMDCPSPANESTDSQTAYLINKYSGGSKMLRAARSLVRAAGTVAASPGNVRAFNSSRGSPALMGSSGVTGVGSKTPNRFKGYSHLDEDSVAPQEEGTELILVSPTPEQFLAYNDDAPFEEISMKGLESPSPVGMGQYPSRIESDILSFDIERDGKPSTSETDDSDSDIFYQWRGSQWDTFDGGTQASGQSYDNLIPSATNRRGYKRRRMFSLAVMLVSTLSLFLAVYFKFYAKSFLGADVTLEDSPCVTNKIISSERFLHIRDHLLDMSLGDTSMLDIVGTPQRKALCWLADFDERQLPTDKVDSEAVLQRYTMGVLFFSLTNDILIDPVSLKSTDFLSAKHECDWDVIMCGKEDFVTALLLADKKIEGEIPAEIANLKNLCK